MTNELQLVRWPVWGPGPDLRLRVNFARYVPACVLLVPSPAYDILRAPQGPACATIATQLK